MLTNNGQELAMGTIIAKNYISFARVLCESFLSIHPQVRCYALIIDDYEGFIDPSDELFEIIQLISLDIPDLEKFCFKYDVLELATAVKPYLLEYLLQRPSINKVVYLDPDIFVTNPLSHVIESLDRFDLILTPHLDSDYPDDGFAPNEATILCHGMFNLGFIGINLSNNSLAFLKWWQGKVYDRCVNMSGAGYYVDQRFIDFVPSLFNNWLIEKHVGYNVAYWNLHSRTISQQRGEWLCNGEPLYFYHFSGYCPEEHGNVSRFSSRHTLADRPDVYPLYRDYRNLVFSKGYSESRDWPYSFGMFTNGMQIPNELRVQYRNSLERFHDDGNPFESKKLQKKASDMERQKKKSLHHSILEYLRWVLSSRAF